MSVCLFVKFLFIELLTQLKTPNDIKPPSVGTGRTTEHEYLPSLCILCSHQQNNSPTQWLLIPHQSSSAWLPNNGQSGQSVWWGGEHSATSQWGVNGGSWVGPIYGATWLLCENSALIQIGGLILPNSAMESSNTNFEEVFYVLSTLNNDHTFLLVIINHGGVESPTQPDHGVMLSQ